MNKLFCKCETNMKYSILFFKGIKNKKSKVVVVLGLECECGHWLLTPYSKETYEREFEGYENIRRI